MPRKSISKIAPVSQTINVGGWPHRKAPEQKKNNEKPGDPAVVIEIPDHLFRRSRRENRKS